MSLLIVPLARDMVDEVVRLHCETFPGFMNTRLGRRYLFAIIDWFRKQADAIALAAIDDGKVAGYTVGAPVGHDRKMNRDLLAVAATSMILRPWVLFDAGFMRQIGLRLKVLIRGKGTKPPELVLPPPTMRLVEIGVSPKMQGKKIGDRLMAAFESESYSRGMKSLRLSVDANNLAARRLYERRGWLPFTHSWKESMSYYSIFPETRP